MRVRTLAALIAVAGMVPAGGAWATDGYFPHGHGIQEEGMGGATMATALDTIAAADNPAAMGFVGNRLDFGLDVFSPRRSASRTGNAFGLNGSATSQSDYFEIPDFGYNHVLTPEMSLGVVVYGHGGMNTDYPGGQIPAGFCGPGAPPSNLLCGQGHLGVDLMQATVAPTFTYKPTPNNAFGISPLLTYQRFRAEGLQAFTGVSAAPADVTNNGYDSSFGVGVRIGWLGKITDALSLGAAYASRTSMSRFAHYRGLFAENGSFDIPENYAFGMAIRVTPQWLVAIDYERINYGDVRAVGNPSTNAAPLGSPNGPGFGWQNVNVVKLGVQYKASDKWTLRAGYNHSDNPVQSRDVTFNILAPGVIQNHYTIGATYSLTPRIDLSAAYMHAQENSVSGPTAALLPGGGTDKVKMYEDSLGFSAGYKF